MHSIYSTANYWVLNSGTLTLHKVGIKWFNYTDTMLLYSRRTNPIKDQLSSTQQAAHRSCTLLHNTELMAWLVNQVTFLIKVHWLSQVTICHRVLWRRDLSLGTQHQGRYCTSRCLRLRNTHFNSIRCSEGAACAEPSLDSPSSPTHLQGASDLSVTHRILSEP